MATSKTDPGKAASDKAAGKGTARETARRQRDIQSETDNREAGKGGGEAPPESTRKSATQAGPRKQPANPLPKQHLRKPGREAELDPAPRFQAPDYRGSGKLEGRVALITGGDSGIGRAVAVLFAREGADVAIVHLDEGGDAEETAGHVEAEGRQCLVIQGDVRDPAFCEAAVARVLEHFGKLDVLVNNAAFQLHASAITDITDAHFDETVRTNVYGYFQMARAAVPHLKEGAAIINTGSETGLFGSSQLLDYSATKGAIHAFTKALASNLVDQGIRVNAVAPGPVWTPLNPADRSAADIQEFGAHSAMKRPAQPEELAPAYVFLAAPSCSSYISGIVLPVLGGPTG